MVHRQAERFWRSLKGLRGVEAVVVFGSAAREEDFVEDLSDVDVLVILSRADRELEGKIRRMARPPLSPAIMTKAEFLRGLRRGDPGILLMCRGKPLYNPGFFKRLKARPTAFTQKRLLQLALYALAISLDDCLQREDPREALSSAYHAARHAFRAEILATKHLLADSNQEILEALPPRERREFEIFLEARRRSGSLGWRKLEQLNLLAHRITNRILRRLIGKRLSRRNPLYYRRLAGQIL
jgi:predicted nucleotidyltransferase